MKPEVNYNFCLFIISNITMGGKEEEKDQEQVKNEILSTLQPAKKPVSVKSLKFQNWFEEILIL